ncbi:Serine/threonine phosphatase stp [Blautia hydrogenotrophica]|nr:protein phosphatase 2C domain-containing protein [Blautia hydrogenotrophica]CUN03685.1 Serine/threonine phosphatase stp [Blautia hydrogenotrophica]SCH99225.1 Serine/threonine phosphatase stp [uncultured Blautia sp.]
MIRHYSLNEQGKRAYQEDSVGVFCEGDHGLFAVADGLGGHGMGTQASQCAVRCALEQYHIGCEPKEYFQRVFSEGNRRLIQIQDEARTPGVAKTTLVCAFIKQDRLFGAHIGDSRMYIFRQNRIVYQTLDHSVPQMLVASGEIRPEEIRGHSDRNRLLRVLGDRDRSVKYQESPP